MDKYYKILGLPPGAPKEDLKKAYRKLATQHHPDRGGNAEVFKEISKAYDLLTGKRQLSRAERAEQEKARSPQPPPVSYSYYEPEPSYRPPPKPKPPRVPEYVEYEYDRWDKCEDCFGKGKLIEYCQSCKGTGNAVYGGPKNEVIVERCRSCKANGHHILAVCEVCGGRGSIFVGKFKKGYWR